MWAPLGRLSYCAYLVHLLVLYYFLNLSESTPHYVSIWYYVSVDMKASSSVCLRRRSRDSHVLRLRLLLELRLRGVVAKGGKNRGGRRSSKDSIEETSRYGQWSRSTGKTTTVVELKTIKRDFIESKEFRF